MEMSCLQSSRTMQDRVMKHTAMQSATENQKNETPTKHCGFELLRLRRQWGCLLQQTVNVTLTQIMPGNGWGQNPGVFLDGTSKDYSKQPVPSPCLNLLYKHDPSFTFNPLVPHHPVWCGIQV